jgi:uncharacterized protein (UPF0303 family)
VSVTDDVLVALLAEEDELQFTSFTNEDAWAIGSRLVEIGRAGGLPIVADVRRGDHQLFHASLAGTTADNDAWVDRKVRVVRRFEHSSFYMGRSCAAAGTTLGERFLVDPREFGAHGGAFPVFVRGAGLAGVVTVSGLAQEEDHRLVVRVLREHLGL